MALDHHSPAWWLGLVVFVGGIGALQIPQAIAHLRPSRPGPHQQVDQLQEQIDALYEQLTALGQTANGQIDQLEQQIDFLNEQLLTLGPAANGPAVYDANGVKVGKVLGIIGLDESSPYKSFSVVPFTVASHVFMLRVYRQNMVGHDLSGVYFESPNCSGQPFMADPDPINTLLPVVIVAQPGSTVYLPDPTDSIREVSAWSMFPTATSQNPPDSCVTFTSPIVPNGRRALPLLDLNTLFTPPFSVH